MNSSDLPRNESSWSNDWSKKKACDEVFVASEVKERSGDKKENVRLIKFCPEALLIIQASGYIFVLPPSWTITVLSSGFLTSRAC